MSSIGTICLLVTTVIYCKIYFITRRHERQIQQVRELEAQATQNSEIGNFSRMMKTAVLRFWFVIIPRFILSAARVITGPNIVITSFSLCRHTLTFFNSLLNPVTYGWRMRQIRHAIMDSLRKVYTNRKLWFWTVRPSHSEGIPIFNWNFLAFSFSFDVCWNQARISVIWKLPMETLFNFSCLCEVSIWFRLIFWLCQTLDAVRLRPTLDVVRSSMTFNSRWSSILENWFSQRTILLLF